MENALLYRLCGKFWKKGDEKLKLHVWGLYITKSIWPQPEKFWDKIAQLVIFFKNFQKAKTGFPQNFWKFQESEFVEDLIASL